jgi:hypothetical protein
MANGNAVEYVPEGQRRPELPGRCNSPKLNGEPCWKRAGYRTDHPGYGRCHLHGGNTPIIHGRYSKLKHLRVAKRMEEIEQDPDPLNILPELALLRALTIDYIERYEENTEAVLAWHQSYVARPLSGERIEALQRVLDECERRMREYDEPSEEEWAALAYSRDTIDRLAAAQTNKPRQVLDLAAAKDLLAEVTKMVERIEKIRSQDAISRPELLRVMTHMGRVVEMFVKDPTTLDKIRNNWLQLHI